MQEEIKHTFENNEEIAVRNEIFVSKDEMKQSLKRLCYGDLYIIGRLWVEALKTVLTGAEMNLIPVLHAAAKTEVPQRPPPMKYKDLPLYTSPHYDYKEYMAGKETGPDAKRQLIHEYILPSVTEYRIDGAKGLCSLCCGIKGAKAEIRQDITNLQNRVKNYFRDPEKMLLRQTLVVLGGLAGLRYTRKRGIPGKLFGTTLGSLLAGSLCFPKETDDVFRNMCYYAGKLILSAVNKYCSTDLALRERSPCLDDNKRN